MGELGTYDMTSINYVLGSGTGRRCRSQDDLKSGNNGEKLISLLEFLELLGLHVTDVQ